jgi:hypothetical protein
MNTAINYIKGDDIWVANLVGQHRLNRDEQGNPPIRYDAVAEGLEMVAEFALKMGATLHMTFSKQWLMQKYLDAAVIPF